MQDTKKAFTERRGGQAMMGNSGIEEETFYESVAAQVRKMGFPLVNGATVDAVHQRQQNREKITHPINQLIAWNLWWRLHHGEEELPA